MRILNIDQLLHLPEDTALWRFFDGQNYKWFVRALIFFFALAGYELLLGEQIQSPVEAFSPLLVGGLAVFFFGLRKTSLIDRFFHEILVAWLFLQYGCLLLRPNAGSVYAWIYAFPVFLLLFRLRHWAYVLLFSWLALAGLYFAIAVDQAMGHVIGITVFSSCCAGLALLLSSWRKTNFRETFGNARTERDRLRMKGELERAREIQLSLLPPQEPTFPGLDMACASIPATEVGGDYYDYFDIPQRGLLLAIGDVSGHGVASSLVLSGVRGCLYLLREELPRPKELLGRLNRMLKLTTDKRMFMTFLLLEIDPLARKVILANAGHPPLIHYRPSSGAIHQVKQKALPLGGIRDASFGEESFEVLTDDLLVLYTDGLIECFDEKGEAYGMHRLTYQVHRWGKHAEARTIRDRIMEDVNLHRGDAEQDDDITLVIVRFKSVTTSLDEVGA